MDYAKVKFGEDDLSLLMLPEKDLLHEIGGRYLAGPNTGSGRYSV
jgi:hypothetical protein